MTDVAASTSQDMTLGPLLIGLHGHEVSTEESDWLRHPAVGGVVLFTRNYRDVSQLSELCASIRALAGRDLLICVDHEGGRVQRFSRCHRRIQSQHAATSEPKLRRQL